MIYSRIHSKVVDARMKKNPHISHLTINSWSATERSIFKIPTCQVVWQNRTRSLVYSCHFTMVLSLTLEKVQVWFLLPKNEHVGPMYSPTSCSVKLQLHKIITPRWYQPFQHLTDILHKASKTICHVILGSNIKQMQTLSTLLSALIVPEVWHYMILSFTGAWCKTVAPPLLSHWKHPSLVLTPIAKFMGPTWGPPGSCWPQLGPILAP